MVEEEAEITDQIVEQSKVIYSVFSDERQHIHKSQKEKEMSYIFCV